MTATALVQVGVAVFVLAMVGAYLRTRLFRCPDCDFRSDYDHIVEATREAPYCAYCGAHMDYVGRKADAWQARLTGAELEPRSKAADVEPEGLLGWIRG